MCLVTLLAGWVESILTVKHVNEGPLGVSSSGIFPLSWKCIEEYSTYSSATDDQQTYC